MTNIFMRVTLFLADLTSVSEFLLKGRTCSSSTSLKHRWMY